MGGGFGGAGGPSAVAPSPRPKSGTRARTVLFSLWPLLLAPPPPTTLPGPPVETASLRELGLESLGPPGLPSELLHLSAWLRQQRCVSCSSGCPGPGASAVGSGKAGLSPSSEVLFLHHGWVPRSLYLRTDSPSLASATRGDRLLCAVLWDAKRKGPPCTGDEGVREGQCPGGAVSQGPAAGRAP